MGEGGVTSLRGKIWTCGIDKTDALRVTIPVSVSQLKTHISNRRTMGIQVPVSESLSWVLDMIFSNEAARKDVKEHTKLVVITQNIKKKTATE